MYSLQESSHLIVKLGISPSVPSGAKARVVSGLFAARLKSCPPQKPFATRLLVAIALLAGAGSLAQQASSDSSSSKTSKPGEHVARTPAKAEDDPSTIYRNRGFGFVYKVPFGWVERTQEMQPENGDARESDGNAQKSKVLLAVFERPPEVSGDSVNSAVVIAEESASAYPGLKTAADYLSILSELTLSKGFKNVEDPYECEVGGRTLPRADFTKELGRLTMRQSSLTMLAHDSLISFTFVGESEDEIENLIEGLHFAPTQPPKTSK